jgi:hypothetical protein
VLGEAVIVTMCTSPSWESSIMGAPEVKGRR